MKIHRLRGILLFSLLIAGVLSGCTPARTPPGADSISGSIDGALYSYHYWNEGLAILIWHNFSYGASGCTGTSSTEDPLYRLVCDVEALDGRRFDWEVTTPDGVTAQMWINGESYDLAEGSIFLVHSQGGETRVVQLLRDVSVIEPDDESIIAFSNNDGEIAAFLERAKGDEIPGESLSAEDAAQAALITFFDHLHAGEYAAAADLYGGSYEMMVDHNPTIDPDDHAALWRAACTINGAQCLQVASAQLQGSRMPEGEFEFTVEFLQDDGTIFSQGPCCGEDAEQVVERRLFTYHVRKEAEYLFLVLDLPVYLP